MTAIRRGAWAGLKYATALYFLGVVAQFFLVGYGLFAMHAGSTIDNAHSLKAHRDSGWAISEVGVVLILLLVLLSWPKPKTLGLYLGLIVLAVAMPFLAKKGVDHKWIGMLHPVDAMLLLGLSGFLAHRSFTLPIVARPADGQPAQVVS